MEPEDLWTSRLPKRLAERAPRTERGEKYEIAYIDGQQINRQLNDFAGTRPLSGDDSVPLTSGRLRYGLAKEFEMGAITQELADSVLHIQLNRPEKRNALNDTMFDELILAAEAARDNTNLAAVVLSGAGRSFCAGLDFAVHQTLANEGAAGQRPFADPADPNSIGQRRPGRGQRIVRALRDSPVPVIAAMQGHAIGGGLQLALGADIRIVTADIVIACAEIDFGMTVDMGGSQLLPRLIGADRALDLLVSGRRITGVQAHSWGLATRISDDPLSEAFELARGIAQRNRQAIVASKHLVRLAETVSVENGMREELSVMSSNIGSPAQVHAVQQYFARRT